MEELVKPKLYDYYIYRVTLMTDGKTYVGKRLIKLWYNPANGMKIYTPGEYYGSGEHIKNAIKAYGVENFTREIIDEYHNITEDEINDIEDDYIKTEWAAGHGEFNHSLRSHGGDIFDGMPEEIRAEVTNKMSESAKLAYEKGLNPLANLTDEQLLARARKIADSKTHDEWAEIARRREANKTPEERSNSAKKREANIDPKWRSQIGKNRWKDLTPEERLERVNKSINNLTPEQRSARRRKQEENMTPDQKLMRSRSYSIAKSTKWIFYNPTTNKYRVHSAAWRNRKSTGFSEKLCKLSDWDDYKSTHNLDVELIY